MFQTTKIFSYYLTPEKQLDCQINDYLEEHPDLFINFITPVAKNKIIVVFSKMIRLNQNDGNCNNVIRHAQLGDIMYLGGRGDNDE